MTNVNEKQKFKIQPMKFIAGEELKSGEPVKIGKDGKIYRAKKSKLFVA